MIRLSYLPVLVFFLILSCQSKKDAELEMEQAVLKDIFPTLIDSLSTEIMVLISPPRIEAIEDSLSGKNILRAVDANAHREHIKRIISEQKKGSAKMILVLKDTLPPIAEEDQMKFRFRYGPFRKASATAYPVDLKSFPSVPGFQIYSSSLYEAKDKSQVTILSRLSLSRIVFDQEGKRGMLTGEYQCGPDCGSGYRIFIRKVEDKWMVDHIEAAWVA